MSHPGKGLLQDILMPGSNIDLHLLKLLPGHSATPGALEDMAPQACTRGHWRDQWCGWHTPSPHALPAFKWGPICLVVECVGAFEWCLKTVCKWFKWMIKFLRQKRFAQVDFFFMCVWTCLETSWSKLGWHRLGCIALKFGSHFLTMCPIWVNIFQESGSSVCTELCAKSGLRSRHSLLCSVSWEFSAKWLLISLVYHSLHAYGKMYVWKNSGLDVLAYELCNDLFTQNWNHENWNTLIPHILIITTPTHPAITEGERQKEPHSCNHT